jgi:hypothetical protein
MVGAQAINRRRGWDEETAVAALDFGLARTTEDFEGAFRLLHDNYVRIGYMDPHESRRRIGLFNALPSTKMFVARDGARVVGTVALVQDSPIGLPMDQIFRDEVSAFRAPGRRLGEASTLTVDPRYRDAGAAILMRLYRMLTVYATSIVRLHDLCMVARAHHARFYRTFFPFREIGPPRPYPRANGAPFAGFHADVTRLRALLQEAGASGMPGRHYDFIFGPDHLPAVLARLNRDLPHSAMTLSQVAHFFAGPGAEAATSLALAARLVSGEPRQLHQLTA